MALPDPSAGRTPRPAPSPGPADLLRVDDLEAAAGWVFGRRPSPPARRTGGARGVLEQVVRESLASAPTFVGFSGGRDSSLVLAVAAHVARRDGLPLPVPLTLTFPGVEGADESAWQELVLAHLGLHERVVVRVTDQMRLLGDAARAGLERRGLVFPAVAQADGVRLAQAAGGHVLTGEGGDDVLNRRRGTPLLLLRRRLATPALPSRRLLREATVALRPSWTLPRGRYRDVVPGWLREDAAREAASRLAADDTSPLRWDRAVHRLLGSRATHLVLNNLGVVAREHDVTYVHPLLDPRFVGAVAADGGAWGFAGRTDMMRRLAADLLPEPVLARTSKAWFNATRWGPDERAFARAWDGSGIDGDLVDHDLLRAAWTAPVPPAAAELLLHAAWLGARGLRRSPG
ncbi:asparagine synthase-related protein [Cellulosimicrobium sp. PMB13]|uniref:asparagine synthase-related protein n=1 Tax=Cellulosimicrobium sp. PMB13 TaxID=3120158 RepID=UPI003F4C308F